MSGDVSRFGWGMGMVDRRQQLFERVAPDGRAAMTRRGQGRQSGVDYRRDRSGIDRRQPAQRRVGRRLRAR